MYEKIYNLYFCNSLNNKDYLNKYYNLNNINLESKEIINKDCKLPNNNYNDLLELFKNNNFISFRPGCVETSFILTYVFKFKLLNNHLNNTDEIDIHLKENAGMYYKNINDKKKVLDWYSTHFIDLIHNSIFTSCFLFLNYDLTLLSLLNIK